jgi:hypothetical protein
MRASVHQLTSAAHVATSILQRRNTESTEQRTVSFVPEENRHLLVGVSFDSAPQRSMLRRRSVMWRCESGGQLATSTDAAVPLRPTASYQDSNGVWTRGVVEMLISFVARHWPSSSGIDSTLLTSSHSCVLRARWFGALRSPMSSASLLEMPHGLLRGATFGPIVDGQPDPSLQHVTRSTTAHGIGAASIEAQFVRLCGSGADLTMFLNVMSMVSPQSIKQPTVALWSAGYSISPSNSHQGSSRQGRVTEWNKFLPQRMECAFPLIFGAGSRSGGGEGQVVRHAAPSPANISWMPKCGFVWDL